MDTMKWLLENGCQFNELTFDNAVTNCNLENIEWLWDNGCPQ